MGTYCDTDHYLGAAKRGRNFSTQMINAKFNMENFILMNGMDVKQTVSG
jgi:hypothetical protein